MNILIGINDKYTFAAKVMLTSLCENNDFEEHTVYLLHDRRNLSQKNIKDIQGLEKQYRIHICPVEVRAELFEDYPLNYHFTIEIYFRLLVQDVLPETVDRVLWMDVDMVVIKSLRDFFYQDFEGKSIIACRTANTSEKDFLARLGLQEQVGYFNSGVILYNLEQIRGKVCAKDFFDCLRKEKDNLLWPDQDVLNIIFADDKKLIENQAYNFAFLPDVTFTDADQRKIDREVYILHYIGGVKPWDLAYQNGRMIRYFRKYARKQETLIESLRFDLRYAKNAIRAELRHK